MPLVTETFRAGGPSRIQNGYLNIGTGRGNTWRGDDDRTGPNPSPLVQSGSLDTGIHGLLGNTGLHSGRDSSGKTPSGGDVGGISLLLDLPESVVHRTRLQASKNCISGHYSQRENFKPGLWFRSKLLKFPVKRWGSLVSAIACVFFGLFTIRCLVPYRRTAIGAVCTGIFGILIFVCAQGLFLYFRVSWNKAS